MAGRWAGPVLLIVMYQAQTWRVRPGASRSLSAGRRHAPRVLPATDRGVSRNAGSFRYHDGSWWLHNDSSSSVLCLPATAGSGSTCRRACRYRCSSGTPR